MNVYEIRFVAIEEEDGISIRAMNWRVCDWGKDIMEAKKNFMMMFWMHANQAAKEGNYPYPYTLSKAWEKYGHLFPA